ncbi:MAG: PIN/TRAM domain-containing protein [Atopostipes suicloacalis]|nr:PIN/TRAM domain-containing protein [Atopostipes suicloacalis]
MFSMSKKILLGIMLIFGSIGSNFFPDLFIYLFPSSAWTHTSIFSMIVGVVLGFLVGIFISETIGRKIKKTQAFFDSLNVSYMLFGTLGAIIGLIITWLVNASLLRPLSLPIISDVLTVIITVVGAYIGFELFSSRREEIRRLFIPRSKEELNNEVLDRKDGERYYKHKVLDTSVIIDGRILDIIQSGFLEGVFVVSSYVLQELQHIADSADSLKRVRGRRGLDILNALQKETDITVKMDERQFAEIDEVDMKLVYLAKELDGAVVTNDYNLNKVAEFQNVPVLNINELANTLKPVVIPGETMRVQIVKEGTERAQGVAYLDDGTMVVVEEGKHHLNETRDVIVTSALQTNAGRMIFAKFKDEKQAISD